jgi:hypothetical protein
MRRTVVGIAAALAVSFAGPAFAEDMTDEIQDEEQPGSQIELDIGGGEATIGRKSGAPLLDIGEVGDGDLMNVPNDPDMLQGGDPIDDELPGEGPEDLSGPDDDDDLPD